MSADPLNVVDRHGRPARCLEGLWAPNPAFLVCGGPSLNDVPLWRLKERGVASLGVNNAAAYAPVRAFVFSDTHWKFHSALFLDPAMMVFAPTPKLRGKLHVRTAGGFRRTDVRLRDCPNVWGFDRRTCFVPEQFYTTPYAHWGPGKYQPPGEEKVGVLCTMLLGLRLLHFLGVRRIYLVGVDHQGRGGKCYGFPSDKRERNRRYRWEADMLARLKSEMDKRGIEVFNCSPLSRLELWPYRSFGEALRDCKGGVPDEPLDTRGWYDKRTQRHQAYEHPPVEVMHFER